MGKGCAIIPADGKVIAPFDGKVVALFPTNHAIGLLSNNGLEVLIHIGLDTVNDNGQDFKANVKNGDRVSKNQVLIEFDKESLENKGYDLTTPIILTSGNEIKECSFLENIEAGELLLKVGGNNK